MSSAFYKYSHKVKIWVHVALSFNTTLWNIAYSQTTCKQCTTFLWLLCWLNISQAQAVWELPILFSSSIKHIDTFVVLIVLIFGISIGPSLANSYENNYEYCWRTTITKIILGDNCRIEVSKCHWLMKTSYWQVKATS